LQLANSYYAAMNDKLVVAEAPTGDSRICLVDVLSNTFDPSARTQQTVRQVTRAQWEPQPKSAMLPGAVTVVDEQFRTLSIVPVAARSSSCPHPGQHQQQRRPQRPERQENKPATATRRRVLMKVLGMQKFYKALALVREGKNIVQDTRRRMKIPQSQQAQQELATPSTQQQQQDQNIVSKGETPLEGWPPVIGDLMLSLTRLVTALEQTHLPELPKLPWDELLPQVHQDIMAYKEWMSATESRE